MKPTLLIVDDMAEVREFLEQTLKHDFEIVDSVENGIQAVEACIASRPQLVVMDIVMPTMSGIEATHQILENKESPPKIVIYSGLQDENIILQALSAGAVDYVLKPANRERLRELLLSLAKDAA